MTLTTFFEEFFRRQKSDPFAIVEQPMVEQPVKVSPENGTPEAARAQPAAVGTRETVGSLKEDIKKLGRTQFRANAVAEADRKELKQMLQDALAQSEMPQQNAIEDLLVVADGLEQALRAGKQTHVSDTTAAAWGEGLRIIHERLLHALHRWEVIPIEAVGRPFDPHLHQAVEVVHSDEAPENTVVSCQRRGYLHQGRVLRYAEVIVARKE